MKRFAAGLGVALVAVLALVLTERSGSNAYVVRAQFDNASGLLTGMDVRAAGAPIGSVQGVTVDQTDPARPKAVALLHIEAPRFRDFRRDARCAIRSQSLIGERYVECDPGTRAAAPLAVATSGAASGQRLLPLDRTSSPVAIDLVLDTFRLPVRQRLSLIVNELGTGLAGNGEALATTLRRAYPTLGATERVLSILSRQRRALQSLTRGTARLLGPLSRSRRNLQHVFARAPSALNAFARRRAELKRALNAAPAALRRLQSTLGQADGLGRQLSPALVDLRAIAPDVARAVGALDPAARAARPALRALASFGDEATHLLPATSATSARIRHAAAASAPAANQLSALLSQVESRGGIDDALRGIFGAAGTVTGTDARGHYLRVGLLLNTCFPYATKPVAGCSAQVTPAAPAADSGEAKTTGLLDYLLGKTP